MEGFSQRHTTEIAESIVVMDIAAATAKANALSALFDRLNEANGQRAWTGLDLALGLEEGA
ncbi:hypothetical protein GALLR39Z86_32170 [Glycomyces algeriensis]|uniref:Uncharacterized protein n=1 Tax=Glycomyces algeriensis TaxID=256037 RepID=A0A9W6GAR0_9ACTN|nr:hypothetical protein GALLR39Z86_32170 [Glycomyces algeriensis]